MAAQKFGCRPSELVVLRDPVLALDFDLAATARLLIAERGEPSGDDAPTTSELYW